VVGEDLEEVLPRLGLEGELLHKGRDLVDLETETTKEGNEQKRTIPPRC